MPIETKFNPMAAQEQARMEQQRKIDSDPTRQFLREQGFEGDPKVTYSLDVLTAKNAQGMNLPGNKSFDNFEDLQDFIKNNPDTLTQQQKERMKEGVSPFKTNYDQSVSDWAGKLPPEKAQQLGSAFDKFTGEKFDPRKWENRERQGEANPTPERATARTGQDVLHDINQNENATLNGLNNPELAQYVGESTEIGDVIRSMGADARQFGNPEERTLAGMANKDLEKLNQLLGSGTPENLTQADQIVANYIYRNVSKKLTNLFNRADLPISWEDKKRLIDQSLLADKISKRADGLKSRDLLSLQRSIEEQIGRYIPESAASKPQTETETPQPKKEVENSIPEQRAASGKEKFEENRTKFGTVLNNLTRQFQDGTISQDFAEFIRGNPTAEGYDSATGKLFGLYRDYMADSRFPSDKIPEWRDKIREVARQFNPDRIKFNTALLGLQEDFGRSDIFQMFDSVYSKDKQITPEQWKTISGKMDQFMLDYRKDKRPRSVKNNEWIEKLQAFGKGNLIN
jgi:hypothetical protein